MDYKALHSKEIKKSEKHVSKLIAVLEYEYLNSFSLYFECEDVYNLSSGEVYVSDADKLVKIL